MTLPSTSSPPPFTFHPPRRPGGTARLVFRGRDRRPVLDPDVLAILDDRLGRAEASRAGLLVVESALPGIFAAGADLHLLRRLSPGEAARLGDAGQRVFARLARFPAPTVALVDGSAFGGGLDLALACDVRLATPRGRFAHPGPKLGIATSWGGTVRLPRLVGLDEARRILYTGDPVDAAAALRIGLVDALGELPRLRRLLPSIAAAAAELPRWRAALRRLRGHPDRRRARLGIPATA